MNGWLVLGRCNLDDVPVGLYATEAEAFARAEAITADEVCEIAGQVLRTDTSVVIGVDVLEFREGVPQEVRQVADWVGEEPDEDEQVLPIGATPSP